MDAAPTTLLDAPSHETLLDSPSRDALPNFTHKQILRVITGVLLCILLAAIDQTVVVPAVPAIAADLHGFGHLSWIVSAYLLTSTAATPIYGRLSDIYGRRALLLPAIALFVAASGLCAMSQSLWQLIAFRALQGVGGAGLMAMAQACIADVVAPRERGKYQAYMAGTWGVASVAGPILGGWITDDFSWRWIFWINLPIGVAAFVLSSRALKMLKVRPIPAKIDYVGAALLTLCVTGILLVMSWGGSEYDWASPQVIGLIVASAVLLAVFVVWERRNGDPLLPPRLFANSVFTRGVVIAALTSAAMFGGTFLLPLFFQLERGADAAASGTLIVPFLAANVVGAFTAGQLARRLGKVKGIVLAGLTLSIVGFGLLAFLGGSSNHIVTVLDMLLVGFGIGITMPSNLVIVQNAAERRDVGVATGTFLFLRSMGAALGSTLVGTLLAARYAAGLAGSGATMTVDLGALRGHEGVQVTLPDALKQQALAALSGAFHVSFLACAALAALGLLFCFGMRDLPLKSSAPKS